MIYLFILCAFLLRTDSISLAAGRPSSFEDSKVKENYHLKNNMADKRIEDIKKTYLMRLSKTYRLCVGAFSTEDPLLLRWTGTAAYVVLQTCSALLILAMILSTSSVYEFFQYLGNISSFVTVMALSSIHLLQEKNMSKLCYQLAEKWTQSQKNALYPASYNIIAHCENKMRFLFYYFSSTSACIFLAYTLYPIIWYYFMPNGGQNPIAFPLKVYLPFEPTSNLRIFLYVVICACIGFYCLLLAVITIMYMSMLCTLEAEFLLNRMFYERFYRYRLWRGTAVHRISRRWDFVRLVININAHQKLYRIANELKELIQETFLLMYGGAIINIAFSYFTFILDPGRYCYSLTIVLVTVLHLFFVFFIPSKVTKASEETADILYSQHRRIFARGSGIRMNVFLIMLMRAQRPVVFEAGRLNKLTLQNYVLFINNVYSFMMLVRKVHLTSHLDGVMSKHFKTPDFNESTIN